MTIDIPSELAWKCDHCGGDGLNWERGRDRGNGTCKRCGESGVEWSEVFEKAVRAIVEKIRFEQESDQE